MRGLFHSPYVCLLLIVGLRASVTPIMKFVLTTGQVDPVHGRRPALLVADVRLGEPLQGATLVGAAIILTGLEVLRRAHLSPSIRIDARSQQALSAAPRGLHRWRPESYGSSKGEKTIMAAHGPTVVPTNGSSMPRRNVMIVEGKLSHSRSQGGR